MRIRIALCATLLLSFSSSRMCAGQTRTSLIEKDGAILDQKPCDFGSYDKQSRFTRRFYSKQDFDGARRDRTVSCVRIRYRSDGLSVVGFLVHPRPTKSRYPVIIFNR